MNWTGIRQYIYLQNRNFVAIGQVPDFNEKIKAGSGDNISSNRVKLDNVNFLSVDLKMR